MRLTTLALVAALAAACRPAAAPLRPVPERARIPLCGPDADPAIPDAPGECGDSVALTYLGVGGFVLRSGGQAVMTAPSFTHPRLTTVLLPLTLRPDAAAIARGLDGMPLGGVTALLVGHAHYDHLLDVPLVLRRHARRADVYGSPTTYNVLHGDPALRHRVRTIADSAVGTSGRPGRWVWADSTDRRIRFMAFHTSHARNFNAGTSDRWWLGRTIGNRVEAAPRTSLPRTAGGWPRGEPYAYLIDVMDGERVRFRLFYQDAASHAEYNRLPEALLREKAVDAAIVCVGSYGNVKDYPASVARDIAPRYLVLGHWEDFFGPPSGRVVRFTNTERLVRELERSVGSRWVTPAPRATLTFAY